MRMLNQLFLVCFVFLLFNCGNDDSNEDSSNEIVGEEGILTNLKATNLDDNNFPWYDIDGLQVEKY